MARHEGEISLSEADEILGCSNATVRRWAQAALNDERSPISSVRRDATGHYWLKREEIEKLRDLRARFCA